MDEKTLWDMAFDAKRMAAQSVSSLKLQIELACQTLAGLPPVPNVKTWTMDIYRDTNFMAVTQAKTELMDLQDYLRDASTAWARFETYEPMKGLVAQCPHCWVNEGKTALLSAKHDGQGAFFKCLECGANYPADVRAGEKLSAAVH